MLAGVSSQQLVYLAILVVAFGLLLTERLRNDVVALLIILALYVTHLLGPEDALAGFSSEPAIVVAGIFVLSAAMRQSGLADILGGWIGRLAGNHFSRAIAVIMPSVALLSAFTHHVTTTAVMLPVVLNLSRERGIPASKLLMPLSFAASLGTTISIIGAPAFLIASALLQQSGRPGLGILSIAPIGLSLSLAGTLFVLLAGRFLLPSHQGAEDPNAHFRLDEYFTELTILPNSRFEGKTIAQAEADDHYHFRVLGWLRGGRRLPPPYGSDSLQVDDVLLVRTTPEEMVAIRKAHSVALSPVAQYGVESERSADGEEKDIPEQMVQGVVAPGAYIAGRTIGSIDFRRRYGAIVVGIWRRGEGWHDQELSQTRLYPGDVLVMQGNEDALARVANDAAFLMLVPFQGDAVRLRRKAPVAGLIMLGVVLLAAFNVMTLEMAALAGAAAAVLTGCVTARQAYRAIDVRIFVFIAGAIPLGAAMEKTGTAQLLAGWLQGAVSAWPQFAVLFALFLIVGVITQFMSDAGTVAVFAPVAIALAQGLGHAPEAYVVTVAMAAVASFFTPIGHHGNLIVYGPGRYRFGDFVRVGTPLTVIAGVIVAALAPLLWPG